MVITSQQHAAAVKGALEQAKGDTWAILRASGSSTSSPRLSREIWPSPRPLTLRLPFPSARLFIYDLEPTRPSIEEFVCTRFLIDFLPLTMACAAVIHHVLFDNVSTPHPSWPATPLSPPRSYEKVGAYASFAKPPSC